MLGFFKQAFIVLAFWLGGSLTTKCVSLNNQTCTSRPTVIDLNPDYHLLTTIYSCLVYVYVMEVVKLLKIHLVEYLFPI